MSEPELLPTNPRPPGFIAARREREAVRAQIDAVLARREREQMARNGAAQQPDPDPLRLWK